MVAHRNLSRIHRSYCFRFLRIFHGMEGAKSPSSILFPLQTQEQLTDKRSTPNSASESI